MARRDTVMRRGLLAGLAALATATIARLTERGASAGHNTDIPYDTQTAMHLNVTNTTVG